MTLGRQITNIYDYNMTVTENLMPHLVVVIDEFAKALQINPAFKTTLDKDIAAQGRALGIHLILSTQKPNDFADFRANVEVRMSMQVQTTDDSRVIFNRDDAARKLTRAGQAYLQVGDNRIFEMFQVARTDVPYKPEGSGSMDLVDDFKIRQMLPNGRYQTLYNHTAPRQTQVQNGRSALSEAEVLVDHIQSYCESRYAKQRVICLPPLPRAPQLPLFPMLAQHTTYGRWQEESGWTAVQPSRQYRLRVPLGMLDLPSAQEQRPYFLNLNDRDGNLIVVGPTGSGKTLLLRSLVLALSATHNPDDLLFYFLSRGTTLSIFEELPHTQAFIQPMESERIMRLFMFLEQEIARRVELMRNTRADSMNALRQARPDLALPSLMLVFDDFSGFIADHFDRLRDMESLASNARQVDLHLVLGVTAMGSIHPKIQQNMQNRIALGLSSTLDIFSQRAKPLPEIMGRGYVLEDQELLEIQIVAPARKDGLDLTTVEAVDEVRDIVTAMKSSWTWADGKRPLPPIGELGKYIQLETLWQEEHRRPTWYEQPTAPIGKDYNLEQAWIELNVLETYNLVIGPAKSGKTDFLLTLALAAAQNFAPVQVEIIVFAMTQRSVLHQLDALPHVKLARNPRMAKEILTTLQADLKERAIQQKEAMERTASGTLAITSYFPLRSLILVDDMQQFSRDNALNQLLDQCMEESTSAQAYLFLADSGNNITQAKQNFGVKYIQNAARYGSGITFSVDSSDLGLLQLMGRIKTPELKLHSPYIGEGRGFWSYQGQVKVVQIARVGAATAAKGEYETAVKQLIQTIAEKHKVED
jgi:S-DNA-T family DNA segregation ATPase FtsK/SpoIIIE